MATPFMTASLGAGARLRIQIAWGANLAAASSTWTWTDVTGDVRQDARVQITAGRTDEAATTAPATCRLTLDNRLGTYSLGVQSSNWPNVRRNTPVRVQVDPSAAGAAYTTRFLGYAVGFTPVWDSTGRDATVVVSAAGTLRRMAQGQSPVLSSFRRALLADTSATLGYWPCEDGQDAESIASALPGGDAMQVSGSPNYAASTTFPCSAPLPTLNGAEYLGEIPGYTATGQIQARFLLDIPASGATDLSVPLRLQTTGTASTWDLQYNAGGSMRLAAYDGLGNTLFATGLIGFALDGKRCQFGLELTQSGADIDYIMNRLEIGATAGNQWPGTLAGHTLGRAVYVQINQGQGDNENVVIGHVLVQSAISSIFTNVNALNAFNGESTTSTRLPRLATENALPLTVVGGTGGTLAVQDTDKMGPQRVGTLLSLLRECETADGGVLYDGINDGLTYSTRRRRYNATATMTIAHTQLVMPFAPVDDDQRTRNKVIATRKEGATATFEDVTGPMGTAAVGTYDEALTVNAWKDSQALQYASWAVHTGTVEGYRYPNLSLDLARNPALAASWLTASIGSRIDVTGISTVRTQHPTGSLSFLLEGYTETIDQFLWDVELNLSPASPWRIIELTDVVGDTNPLAGRLAPDGSTLATAEAIGSTVFSVATASGPLWTTAADDFPLTIEVSGIPITVTSITGAASPQTFNVTGSTVTKALLVGAAVTIYNPTALAL